MEIDPCLINKICEGSATDEEIEKYLDLMNKMMENNGYLDSLKMTVKIYEGTATDTEIEQWAEKNNIQKEDITIAIEEMKRGYLDGIELGPEIFKRGMELGKNEYTEGKISQETITKCIELDPEMFKRGMELGKNAYTEGKISQETITKCNQVAELGPSILTKDPEIEKLWSLLSDKNKTDKNVTELDKDEIIISLTCVLDQLDSIKNNVNMLLQVLDTEVLDTEVLDTETNKCIKCDNTTSNGKNICEKCISLKNERVRCIGCGYETEPFYNHYCVKCCPQNFCDNTTSNNKKYISLKNEIAKMTDEQIKEKYDHSLYIIDEEY